MNNLFICNLFKVDNEKDIHVKRKIHNNLYSERDKKYYILHCLI